MLFLALETSSIQGSIALFRDRECLDEVLFPEGLVHGREIAVRIRDLCAPQALRLRDIEGIAAGVGPGSYTGSRVGVTAAKTLAFSLRLPLVQVSSLEVLAATSFEEEPGDGLLLPALDARRGLYYTALFRSADGAMVRLAADRVGAPQALVELLRSHRAPDVPVRVSGDGADGITAALRGALAKGDLRRGRRDADIPRARVLGKLAAEELAGREFEPESVHGLEPAYLRPSEPEILLEDRGRTLPAAEGPSRDGGRVEADR